MNNPSDQKEFTRRYQALMGHDGLILEKINARGAHENGDAEQSHNRFKQAVDQALQLREPGFHRPIVYARFLREVRDQRNAGRQKHLARRGPRGSTAPWGTGELQACTGAGRAGSGVDLRGSQYLIHS